MPGNITGNKIGEISGLNLDSGSKDSDTIELKSEMVVEIIKNLELKSLKIKNQLLSWKKFPYLLIKDRF